MEVPYTLFSIPCKEEGKSQDGGKIASDMYLIE